MSDFIDSLFKSVPWLRPTLAWSIGFLLVFLILTLPAYFILWPFLQRARAQLLAFIRGFAERLKTTRTERTERLNHAADEFLQDGGLWRLNSEGAGRWSALAGRLARVLEKLRSPVIKSSKSLDRVSKGMSSLEEELRQSDIATLEGLPVLPPYEEVVDSGGGLRVALLTLILSGMILLGLMVVNTGMLSQILRDLGVVPPTMIFLGFPLAYVFAFILTLVEAGLGVTHAATLSKNPDKISIWPFILTAFAIVLGIVEGFFYSRVAPTGTFAVPFLNYEMPQSYLFFFWGFVLVMTLFALGGIGFENSATALRGTKSGSLRREIKKLQIRHERYARAAAQSHEALIQAKSANEATEKLLQGPGVNGESLREELNRVWKEVKGLKETAPEWARDTEAALTRTEVHQLAQKGGLWLTLAILGMVVITITGLNSFEVFNPNLKLTMLWVLAVGQAVLFSGVGFLLGVGETVVRGTGSERSVWASPQLSRLGAYLVGGLLVVTYIVLFVVVAWPMGLGAVWFSNFVVGLFLIAAGYQLSPLLNVVRLWLWRLSNVLLLVLETSWLALIRLVHFAVVILENVAYLLATPLDKVFGHRGQITKRQTDDRGPLQNPTSPRRRASPETTSASGVIDDQHGAIEPTAD